MHVKGLEMPAYDIRGAKAHGLSTTSYTGADHNRGYSNHEILVFGAAPVNRFAVEGKAGNQENQDIAAAAATATMCNFILGQGLC